MERNLQSSRPRFAIDSPNVLARMNGAPPGAERSPAAAGIVSSSLRVNGGTQHVISQEGPEQPPSLTPPFIQHITVSVQLSHCPSVVVADFANCLAVIWYSAWWKSSTWWTYLRFWLRPRWRREVNWWKPVAGSSWTSRNGRRRRRRRRR